MAADRTRDDDRPGARDGERGKKEKAAAITTGGGDASAMTSSTGSSPDPGGEAGERGRA